jgi:tetratricopeptide (TPR) repeat protein
MFQQEINHRNIFAFLQKTLPLSVALVACASTFLIIGAASTEARTSWSGPLTNLTASPQDKLEPGRPIARELAGGQTHSYQLKLSAGQFTSVIVQQRGIDVVEQLFAPDGRLIAEFDDELRPQEAERAEFVAEVGGAYRLDVTAKFKGDRGNYEIWLAEVRAATEKDRWLQESRKLEVEYKRLYTVGNSLDERMVPLAERALALREKALGPNDPQVAEILQYLGDIYLGWYQDYAKTEAMYRRALDIREQSLGPNHPAVATSLDALANVQWARGENVGTELMYRRALTIYENSLGDSHPSTLLARGGLAGVYWARGDLTQTEAILRSILAAKEKSLGPEAPEVAEALGDLASLYIDKREYETAEPLFQRALVINEKAYGPNSSLAIYSLSCLAYVHSKMGDYAKAEAEYLRVVSAEEARSGPEGD